jgi:hypothetical protein
MPGSSPETNHRLRSEKSHQELGRRGFDSPHLQECSGFVREHCWRCARPPVVVAIEDDARPLDRVADANARRLRSSPQFEVLSSIVIAHTIAMMDRLARLQIPSENFFRNKYVFEDVWTRSGPWMVRNANHDVASLVQRASTLPVSVRRCSNRSARGASCRLRLPRSPTCTRRLRATGRAMQVSTGRPKLPAAFGTSSH